MNWSANLLKKMIAWIIVLAFIAYVFYFFYSNTERLQRLFDLSFSQIIVLITLSILCFLGLAQQLVIMLLPYTRNLTLIESFQLSISNNLLNYLPLKTGAIAKGMYLKTAHQLRLQDYIIALIVGQLVWIIVSAVLGCLGGLVIIFNNQSDFRLSLGLVILVLFVAAWFSYFLLYFAGRLYSYLPLQKLQNFFQQYSASMQQWLKSKNILRFYCVTSLLVFLLFTIRIWFSFQIVGQNISLSTAIIVQACIGVGFAFSLVPGNLGLKEGVIVGLAVLFGIDSETAMLAAVIDRAASLLPTLMLGPFFLHRLTTKLFSLESAKSP